MQQSQIYRASVRLVGVCVLLVCGLISAGSFISGIAVFGKRDIIYGCAAEAPRPTVGGPFFEDTQVVSARRTVLPLGVVCVLDSPENKAGPQTVEIQSWPDTIAWITFGALALLGAVLLVHPGAPQRVRARRSRRSP